MKIIIFVFGMRSWVFILVLCLLPVFLCRGQEIPGNPSLLEISEYLALHPDGPLADAYSDQLALRRAQALGAASTEADYQLALSTARSEPVRLQIRQIWDGIQEKKQASFQRVRNLTSSHVSMYFGAVFTSVNALLWGFEYRWGHDSRPWHYNVGAVMEGGGLFGGPENDVDICIEPFAGISYRLPSIHSFVKSELYFDFSIKGGHFRRAFTPELSLEYGYTPFQYVSIALFVRATPFPFFHQKEYYENSKVEYSVLKPHLDERIRVGIKVYMNIIID